MKSLTKKHHDRLVQEAKQKEAHRIVREQWEDQCRKADVSVLYALHTVFGFGAIRCRRFYLGMIKNYLGMVKHWQSGGDDSHFWIMEERLKAAGINVDDLIREAGEMVKEDNNGNT